MEMASTPCRRKLICKGRGAGVGVGGDGAEEETPNEERTGEPEATTLLTGLSDLALYQLLDPLRAHSL